VSSLIQEALLREAKNILLNSSLLAFSSALFLYNSQYNTLRSIRGGKSKRFSAASTLAELFPRLENKTTTTMAKEEFNKNFSSSLLSV
jgi:hypothetical protein